MLAVVTVLTWRVSKSSCACRRSYSFNMGGAKSWCAYRRSLVSGRPVHNEKVRTLG